MVLQGADDVQLLESFPFGETYKFAVLPPEEPPLTVIENAPSDVVALPSEALITMFEDVPTLELDGVPDS
ncbi:MAG TPA: hypothetical protein VFS24_15615 [Steroidobacteraceae bacterium]|nr:hypothetical protein [Steroidobacteraceae bacterium]